MLYLHTLTHGLYDSKSIFQPFDRNIGKIKKNFSGKLA